MDKKEQLRIDEKIAIVAVLLGHSEYLGWLKGNAYKYGLIGDQERADLYNDELDFTLNGRKP